MPLAVAVEVVMRGHELTEHGILTLKLLAVVVLVALMRPVFYLYQDRYPIL